MKGRRRARSLVLAAGALALVPSLADAGPWNRRPGGFYAKLGYHHLRATELATPAGGVVEATLIGPRYDSGTSPST